MEIPEDMEAGEYPVTIRLIHKGEVLTEKNVSLEVIGAVLPGHEGSAYGVVPQRLSR